MTTPRRPAFLPWLGPFIVLVAAVLLAALWDRLPDRWPSHWGPDGEVDGWSTRTVPGVFGPLVIGLGVWALIEAAVASVRRGLRAMAGRDVDPARVVAHADALVDVLRMVGAAIVFVCAALSLILPLASPSSPTLLLALVLLVVGGVLAHGMARMARAMRRFGPAPPGSVLEGWNGLVYKNPQDPRLWVPRLDGLGYTLNFAHRRAWLVLALILAIPVALVALPTVLGR